MRGRSGRHEETCHSARREESQARNPRQRAFDAVRPKAQRSYTACTFALSLVADHPSASAKGKSESRFSIGESHLASIGVTSMFSQPSGLCQGGTTSDSSLTEWPRNLSRSSDSSTFF